MLGLEAPIERRRASGSGRITLPGNSHIGDLGNQTTRREVKTACNTMGNGMMNNAQITPRLSAAGMFAWNDQNLTNWPS